jgi:hypothetical protein
MSTKQEWFSKHLKKANIDDEMIDKIVNVEYQHSEDEKQDNANFYAAAMEKCNELLILILN